MLKEVIKSTLDAFAFSQVVRKEGFMSEGILLNLTETVITDQDHLSSDCKHAVHTMILSYSKNE